MPFWSSQLRPTQVALVLRGKDIRSTHFKSSRQKYYFFVSSNQFIVSYKYHNSCYDLNSNNQIVSLYFYDNKKQTTIINSLCHFKPNVNHLRSTPTYTSYFLLFFYVNKYYKLVVCASGDSVKSDQTYMYIVDVVICTLWM